MNASERNEILEMLAEGKITAAEAIDLLDGKAEKASAATAAPDPINALKAEETGIPTAGEESSVEAFKAAFPKRSADYGSIVITEDDVMKPGGPQVNGERPRWLKIRVRDLDTGHNRVNVSLPVGIVSFGLGIARRFGAEFDDQYNVDEIWKMVKEGERGVLVDVEDEEDNKHIQIYLD
jgi:hypothetical protein